MEYLIACPVCLLIPKKKIYQCTSGHIICSKCSSNLKNCPQCRVSYGAVKIRARVLEDVLDNSLFDCTYHDKGCSHKCKRSETSHHEKSCSFNPDNSSLCQTLGFSECTFNGQSRDDIISHFKDAHIAAYHTGYGVEIFHVNFKNIPVDTPHRCWSPVILSPDYTQTSPLFLVRGQVDSQMGASWDCVHIWGTTDTENKYKLEFSLQENLCSLPLLCRGEYPTTVRRDLCSKSHNSKTLGKTVPIVFPLSFIMNDNYLLPDGTLRIIMQISQQSKGHQVVFTPFCTRELCIFLQPIVEDLELKAATEKLQRLGLNQRELLNKQIQESYEVTEKKRRLALQLKEWTNDMNTQQRQIEEEQILQKQSFQQHLHEKKLCLEKKWETREEEINHKEKKMLERHLLEIKKLNVEKLQINKSKEESFKHWKESESLQLKTMMDRLAIEKQELENDRVTTDRHMNDEIKLLDDQQLEYKKTIQQMLNQERQIGSQLSKLDEHLMHEQMLQMEIIEKQNDITAQKKAIEEQMLAKQLSEKEMLEAAMQEKRRKLKVQMTCFEETLSKCSDSVS